MILPRKKAFISQITDWLYISSEARAVDTEAIIERDIGLVISMIGNHRPPQSFDQHPLQLLWLQTYDTFLTPIPMSYLILGVEKALPFIQSGKGVLCFCQQGRHRSVAMAASILIGMGYSAEEAMTTIRSKRKIARPQTWHIRKRIELFEKRWPQHNEQSLLHQDGRKTYSEFITDVVSKLVWRLGLGRNR